MTFNKEKVIESFKEFMKQESLINKVSGGLEIEIVTKGIKSFNLGKKIVEKAGEVKKNVVDEFSINDKNIIKDKILILKESSGINYALVPYISKRSVINDNEIIRSASKIKFLQKKDSKKDSDNIVSNSIGMVSKPYELYLFIYSDQGIGEGEEISRFHCR